jgi:peptidoglycan/xylan/chitin deacetylase (PgdA/CDA1 family)
MMKTTYRGRPFWESPLFVRDAATTGYYNLKPMIPRRLQIGLRRLVVQRRRGFYADVWPIDEKAGDPPPGWTGWPDRKRFALILTHDVETRQGLAKCYPVMRLEEKMGFKSSFNFVPEGYPVSPELRNHLKQNGFEVGLHGLVHHGNLFRSRKEFKRHANRINRYLNDWEAVGFRAPSMFHNLDWIHDLRLEYDASTFDTDPFMPQPDGLGTIFPCWIQKKGEEGGYVELPYTLPQDFTLFVLMREGTIDIWKKKLDWIAERGGMALLITHPDYMSFGDGSPGYEQYPPKLYEAFLHYIKETYGGQYWHVLPREISRYWKDRPGRRGSLGTRETVTP